MCLQDNGWFWLCVWKNRKLSPQAISLYFIEQLKILLANLFPDEHIIRWNYLYDMIFFLFLNVIDTSLTGGTISDCICFAIYKTLTCALNYGMN